MAESGAIRAGRAFVELFADSTKLEQALGKAKARLRGFAESVKAVGTSVRDAGKAFALLGTAALTPLLGAAKLFGHAGDELAKMSDRTGISVEALSELRYAAAMADVEMEALETGVRRMQRTLGAATEGSSEAIDAFRGLGMSVEELINLTPDQQLAALADAIAGVDDPAQRAAAAMNVFGRAGTGLLPFFKDGAAGIERLRGRARELGLTMGTKAAREAEAFNDAMTELWLVLRNVAVTVGADLVPLLNTMIDTVRPIAVATAAWVKANRGLFASVALAASGIVLLGSGLVALGFTLEKIGSVIGALGTGFGVMKSVVTAAVSVFKVIGPAIASPIGVAVLAAVASLAALGVALYQLNTTFRGFVDSMASNFFGALRGGFAALLGDARTTFRGVADALAAGDIQLAARVLWAFLKLEWTRGVTALQITWANFRGYVLENAVKAFYGVREVWEIVGRFLVDSWTRLSALSGVLWANSAALFTTAWVTAVGFVENRIHELMGLLGQYDAAAAKSQADRNLDSVRGKIEEDRWRAVESNEKARREALGDSAQVFESHMARLAGEEAEARRAIAQETASRIAEAESALQDAKQGLADAADAARKARDTKDASAPPEVVARKAREGAGAALLVGSGVRGTFNPFESARLAFGPSSDLKKIADSTRKTADNTGSLLTEFRRQSGVNTLEFE